MPDGLAAHVDRGRLVEDCLAAVRTPSPPGGEAEVAALVARIAAREGLVGIEVDPVGNVIARLSGRDPSAPSLMVNGHTDHVPPGAMADPFAGLLVDAARFGGRGEAIYGRGSLDMKCNVVAAIHGLGALARAGRRPAGDVVLVADVQEEPDSPEGVLRVIRSGVRADRGLSVEATGLAVHVGHRGKVEVEVLVEGRTSHASEPTLGENAVFASLPVLERLARAGDGLPEHPLLGPATCTVVQARSGPGDGDVAVVPDRMLVRVDRRYVVGEGPETVLAEVEALLADARRAHPALRATARLANHYPLLWNDPDGPLVADVRAARARALGDAGRVGAWRFGVNGTFMAAEGIPTVGIGAGDERFAHTPEEHVVVDDLVSLAAVVGEVAAGG